MDLFTQDFRLAIRSLGRRPWFAGAIVLMIAIGIGVNAAIFSVVDAVLLKPLAIPQAEQMVIVWGRHAAIGREVASYPDYQDWKTQTSVFDGLTSLSNSRLTLALKGEELERIPAAVVESNFFDVLRTPPAMGRTFTPSDGVFGNHRVVVLSDALWRERFGADRGVIGRAVTLNAASYEVIGVAAPETRFPESARLWTPMAFDPASPPRGRRSDFLTVIGRLKPEATIDQAQRDMTALMKRLEEQYPATNAGWSADVVALRDQIVSGARAALLTFSAAVGLVLLIVCANVANLLLARAATRDREMAIRASLGATRARLIRQVLSESVVLAVVGGVLGVVFAAWTIGLFPRVLPTDMPRLAEVTMSWRVLAFALGASIGTGVLFGMAPALRMSAGALTATMQDGARGTSGGRGATRMRNGLVLAQVSLALVNLLGCGLLVRSFIALQAVDPGFVAPRVMAFEVPLPRAKYTEMPRASAFFDQLVTRLDRLPGVQAAGLTSDLPLSAGYAFNSFTIEGAPAPAPDVVQDGARIVADDGYFGALSIPLKAGRMFGGEDRAESPGVAIVSEAFVSRYFRGGSPLGRRITFGDPADSTGWLTIVGVVGDTQQESMASDAKPAIYQPVSQQPQRVYSVVMRTSGDPSTLLASVRREVRAMDPDVPLADVATMEQRIATSLTTPRLTLGVAAVFSALAVILALTGIYAVVSYAVAQRTRELGIRMALGATAGDVVRLVVRQGMTPALWGVGLGVLLALGAARVLSSLLFGVSPTDPVTFIVAPVLLALVAMLACWIPARQATRIDPNSALRYE